MISTLPNPIHYNYSSVVPFWATLVTLFCFVSLWTIRRIFHRPHLPIIYDNCNWINYTNQYVIRLLFNGMSTSYRSNETNVNAHIIHSFDRILKVTFTPLIMDQMFLYKGRYCSKVFVRTGEKYFDVRSVWLFHDGSGTIVVQSFELQDIKDNTAVIAEINYPIGPEVLMRKVSPFPFEKERPCELEEDIHPTKNVTWIETSYIIFPCIMTIFCLIIRAMVLFCEKSSEKCSWEKIFMFSFGSFGLALGMFISLAVPFRCCVKTKFHDNMGSGVSAIFRILYITFLLIIGMIVMGLMISQSISKMYLGLPANFVFDRDIYWAICTSLAVSLFFLSLLLSLPLAFWSKYIQVSGDKNWKKDMRKNLMQRKPKRKVKVKAYKSDEAMSFASSNAAAEDDGIEEDRSDFKPKRKKNIKPPDVGPDPGYTDSTFYESLIKKKDIRSISQYKDKRPQIDGPKRAKFNFQAGKGEPVDGYDSSYTRGSATPVRSGYDSAGAGAGGGGGGGGPVAGLGPGPGGAPRSRDRIRSKPKVAGQPKKYSAKSVSTESQSGEDYYATMMKMAKIRSVSQYNKKGTRDT